jgi:NAD(P)-dependent dehydrogenase (short-subunit alcohol dehydrogenase family)
MATWRSDGGGAPMYGMTKAALDRFSANIANDLFKSNVPVFTVYPGYTVTERIALLGSSDPNRNYANAEKPGTSAKALAYLCRDPMRHTGRIFESRQVVDEHNL